MGLTFFRQFALFRFEEQSVELFHGVFVPLVMDFWHSIKGEGEAALDTGKYDGKKGGGDGDGDGFCHCNWMQFGVMGLLLGGRQMQMEERHQIFFRLESWMFGIGACSLDDLYS